MGGSSGKSSTSSQQVTIPPEVLANYQNANSLAQQAAAHPFQQYSTDPSAFVAPMSATQNAGVAGTNAAANQAQPYFSAATQQLLDAQNLGAGMTGSAQTALLNAKNRANPYNDTAGQLIGSGLAAAQPLNQTAASGYSSALAGAQPYNQAATGLAVQSAQAVNPTDLDSASIQKYMSPYLQNVLSGTAAQLNQDNQRAMSGQTGSAISQGAFGGDRAGLAAATLAGQQQLANAQIYSGILNQGYGQALGAAQQQQGVGLSAAQANRSAIAGAGQQLQSIGQQGYAQGTGTASQQAALGQQEYGQGVGAGQAVQGLGQQVFGQGLSTSQQEAALAQQIYGMGSNTAQQLAGLGAGAQTAGLQGAQAQLSAGQVQQQTQQAGDTALYNQFLQQQSYPFQTAQFLANVAEGTGSLSGSTTTTTQPGGFFSDERLKEDIKHIGKTFDGQTIYSFKYKGDPRTQVGLMAQDVEKKHPEAVGEASGFKTVDYGKATEDAAERGRFAGGGAPMLPGLSGADMSALLAAQEQMYAPFSQAGGLYGGQAGGMPRGGSSYVPQGNLPVSHLAVAGGLAPQKSGLESVKEIADLASKAAPYAQKGEDWLKDKWAARNDNTMSANENEAARGGLVPAKKYASGGMPYDAQTGLDIPDETPSAKLQTAGELPGHKSGMDTAMDMAKIGLMIAGLKTGGRVGFADGGAPFDDTTDFATPDTGGGMPWYLKPVPGPEATGHAIMQGLHGAADRFFEGQGKGQAFADTATTHAGLFGPKRDDAPAPYVGTPVGPIKTAAPVVAPVRHIQHTPSSGLSPAVAATDAELPTVTPASAQTAPSGGLAPPPAASNYDLGDLPLGDASPSTVPAAVPQNHPGFLSRIASGLGDNVKDYASGLKHGDAQNWLPLISAIAAAGTAPTVHPGVALAAGLGAGAQSYMGVKQKLADVAQTQAQTGNIGAHTTQTQQGNAINFYKLAQAGILRPDPAGTIVDPATGTHYSNAQEPASGIPGGAPTPTYKYLGPHAQAALSQSSQQFAKDSPALGITPNEGNIATSNKIISDTYQASQDAKTAKNLQNEQAAAILSQARGGALTQGAMAPIFQPYVAKFNSIVTDAGHPEWAINGLGDVQIADKLQQAQALAQTSSSGQQSYRALTDAHALSPSGHLDPKAAATLMAQNAVMSTRAIDQQNMLDEAKHHAQNGNYEAQDMLTAFNADNPPTIYNAMRDAVADIYQKPEYSEIHAALAHPGSPKYQTIVNTLNAFGKSRGIPNFARVFTGD